MFAESGGQRPRGPAYSRTLDEIFGLAAPPPRRSPFIAPTLPYRSGGPNSNDNSFGSGLQNGSVRSNDSTNPFDEPARRSIGPLGSVTANGRVSSPSRRSIGSLGTIGSAENLNPSAPTPPVRKNAPAPLNGGILLSSSASTASNRLNSIGSNVGERPATRHGRSSESSSSSNKAETPSESQSIGANGRPALNVWTREDDDSQRVDPLRLSAELGAVRGQRVSANPAPSTIPEADLSDISTESSNSSARDNLALNHLRDALDRGMARRDSASRGLTAVADFSAPSSSSQKTYDRSNRNSEYADSPLKLSPDSLDRAKSTSSSASSSKPPRPSNGTEVEETIVEPFNPADFSVSRPNGRDERRNSATRLRGLQRNGSARNRNGSVDSNGSRNGRDRSQPRNSKDFPTLSPIQIPTTKMPQSGGQLAPISAHSPKSVTIEDPPEFGDRPRSGMVRSRPPTPKSTNRLDDTDSKPDPTEPKTPKTPTRSQQLSTRSQNPTRRVTPTPPQRHSLLNAQKAVQPKRAGSEGTRPNSVQRAMADNSASYELWLRRIREEDKRKRQEAKAKEEAEKKKKEEQKANAEKAFERWKQEHDRRQVELRKQKRRQQRDSEEKAKQEKEERKKAAEKVIPLKGGQTFQTFEHWKKSQEERNREERQRKANAERQRSQSAQAEKRKLEQENAKAYREWRDSLNARIQEEQQRRDEERRREQEQLDEEKEFRDSLAKEAYDVWLEMKRHEHLQENTLAHRIMEYDAEARKRWPQPWIPTGNTVPRKFVGTGNRRRTLDKPLHIVQRRAKSIY